MKLKNLVALCVFVLSAVNVHASVRSVRGLWVASSDDRSYWLRLQVSDSGPAALVEDLTGTITSSSVGGTPATTQEAKVTGQYLFRTGIVILNVGESASHREYAIGDTRGEGRHMNLRFFKVKRGQDLDFERELLFDPKSEPQQP